VTKSFQRPWVIIITSGTPARKASSGPGPKEGERVASFIILIQLCQPHRGSRQPPAAPAILREQTQRLAHVLEKLPGIQGNSSVDPLLSSN
jgi:hypothetical protein